MLLSKNQMVGLVAPQQHIGIMHAKWKELGKDMPFALALGTEPGVPFVSGMPLPANVTEVDYLGGFFGEPIDVVQCETVDLQVPATAEIVIEGYLSAEERANEGPMGEYAGYLWLTEGATQPIYKVTAITHRDNPILPVVAAGYPVEEDHTCWGIGIAANVLAST
jgi:UbiD family decarboxylase